jgi:hypothetical protein
MEHGPHHLQHEPLNTLAIAKYLAPRSRIQLQHHVPELALEISLIIHATALWGTSSLFLNYGSMLNTFDL